MKLWWLYFLLWGALPMQAASEQPTIPPLHRSPGGTTYYVDSERGNDQHPGTSQTQAWKTLARVNEMQFAPGDKILFGVGTQYQGQLVLHGSGAKRKPIVVASYGKGARPRVDAAGETPQALLLRNEEYWEILDLEITNQGPTPGRHRNGVEIALEDFGTAHGIRLSNLYVHDVNSSNVKEQGGSGIVFHNSGQHVKSRFDGLVIEKCHLLRTDRNGITGWSEYWPRDKWYPNLHVVIRNNLLEDIGGDGIVPIGCDGCIIEHNVLRGGRRRAEDYAAGIWPWSCDNTLVQFNEVSGMRGTRDGQGFDADWNCQNTIIQYNYSHDNDGGFVLICNDGSSKMPWSIGNVRPIVRYNISQNDGARTFQISAITDARIYNNTIYVKPEMEVYGVHCHSWSGWPKGITFENNIFYADGTMRYDFGASEGVVFRNNVFYGHHQSPPEDSNGLTVDPKLMRPGSGGKGFTSLRGYTLTAASPCRKAGIIVKRNGGRDFWGKTVPTTTRPDIGANQRP